MKKNSEIRHKLAEADDDALIRLQQEIAVLEAELSAVRNKLGVFEAKIHARLDNEFTRMRELYALYKQQKKEKKAKRLEQKQRGKNYVAPKQLVPYHKNPEQGSSLSPEQQKALRQLYKEAVVQVHPDKFVHSGEHDRIARANAITARLNGIYQSGDLEELISFYQYIISGDALRENSVGTAAIPDPKVKRDALVKKKEEVLKHLDQLKSSYTYHVLNTYDDPLTFIEELHQQLLTRIMQLEKRTRTSRGA